MSPHPPDIAVAMVLLKTPRLPAEVALREWLAHRHVELPPFGALRRDGDVHSAEWGPLLVAFSLMPMPVPLGERSTAALSHRAHLIVTVAGGDLDVVERCLALTWLTAAMASQADAAGVYWGAGDVLIDTEAFVTATDAMSREQLPLDLWIDFRFERDHDGVLSLFTNGMDALGHMEIEVERSTRDAATIRNRAWSVAHYLLDHGAVLKDGDTIGLSDDERIRVTHSSSRYEPGKGVLRLAM